MPEANLQGITLKGHTASVTTLCYDETSQSVFSASLDGNLKRWTPSGELIASIKIHKEGILCLGIHARYVLSGSLDKTCAAVSKDVSQDCNVFIAQDSRKRLHNIGSYPFLIPCRTFHREMNLKGSRCLGDIRAV